MNSKKLKLSSQLSLRAFSFFTTNLFDFLTFLDILHHLHQSINLSVLLYPAVFKLGNLFVLNHKHLSLSTVFCKQIFHLLITDITFITEPYNLTDHSLLISKSKPIYSDEQALLDFLKTSYAKQVEK